MDVDSLANNRKNDPDQNKTAQIQSIQMEEPFSVLAGQTNKPEGNDRKENIAKRAVNPTVKHSCERNIPQSIEVGL